MSELTTEKISDQRSYPQEENNPIDTTSYSITREVIPTTQVPLEDMSLNIIGIEDPENDELPQVAIPYSRSGMLDIINDPVPTADRPNPIMCEYCQRVIVCVNLDDPSTIPSDLVCCGKNYSNEL